MVALPSKLFISGTDTNVGKTVVSALLTVGFQGCYWKPIQSGAKEGRDRDWVKSMTQLPAHHFFEENYCLQEPLSPHAAAALEAVEIKLDHLELPKAERPLFVEGAGGVLVPLNQRELMIDLIDHLKLPVLLVARSSLGTINHTLLTLHLLRSRQIPVAGVVLNGPPNPSNRHAIEFYGSVPVVAELPVIENLSFKTIRNSFESYFGHINLKKR